MPVGVSLQELSSLIRSLLRSRDAEPVSRTPERKTWAGEDFHLDYQSGGTVLSGKFQVGGRFIWVSHRQWEGDSYPLNLQQRKEILRRTIQERLRKEAG